MRNALGENYSARLQEVTRDYFWLLAPPSRSERRNVRQTATCNCSGMPVPRYGRAEIPIFPDEAIRSKPVTI